jgi:hypothetical protein
LVPDKRELSGLVVPEKMELSRLALVLYSGFSSRPRSIDP